MPITRDEAWQLLCDWTPSEKLRVHARAVELVMRDLGTHLRADVEAFGIAGLLHDADYDQWPAEHPKRIVAWLSERGEASIAHAAERVNDFETGSCLNSRSGPRAAERRRDHGQASDCLAATCRRPALRVRSLSTAPWKTRWVSHTSPQPKAIIMLRFPFSVD